MTDLVKKMLHIHRNAPLLLQPRIARAIEAMESVGPHSVSSPVNKKYKLEETSLDILEDNSDSFLALMRTLPKKHKFKQLVGDITDNAETLKRKMEETGQELAKLLQSDEEELPGIKASALSELASRIERESTKLSDVIQLTKTLNTLAGKVHKEEKTGPVEHDLPGKEVEPDGKSDKDDEKPPAIDPLPENPGGTASSPKGSGGGINELFNT